MGPSISVVIPVYNRFEYLNETLRSVFNQTLQPLEVIVVDDCSSRSLADYFRENPAPGKVRMIRTDRNRRVAGARNWGWRRALGDWVAFVDSDDLWAPTKLEQQVEFLRRNPSAAGIYGSLTAFWPNGRTEMWADDRPPVVDAPEALLGRNITVQTLLIRRSALELLNGFDERFGILDDQDIAIRAANAGVEIQFFADPPLVHHRRHEDNYSDQALTRFFEEWRIGREYRELADRAFGPGSRRIQLGRALSRLANGSQTTRLARVPARLLSNLLYATAPDSSMPRR